MAKAVDIAGNSFSYITATASTQVATGAGVLKRIVINKALTGTVKIIDNTTGTTANIATLTNGTTAPLGSVDYDVVFSLGLRVVNSAAEDITVVFHQ